MRNPPLPKISTFPQLSTFPQISTFPIISTPFWPHENMLIMSGHSIYDFHFHDIYFLKKKRIAPHNF